LVLLVDGAEVPELELVVGLPEGVAVGECVSGPSKEVICKEQFSKNVF
jgi:hypothetical protein